MASARTGSRAARLLMAPCGFTCCSLTPLRRQKPASAATWYTTSVSASAGVTSMARRPKPTRSGKLGWAPTATPAARQARTVRSMTRGSPPWKPQATLAEVTSGITSSSRPSSKLPKLSPRSAFRSTAGIASPLWTLTVPLAPAPASGIGGPVAEQPVGVRPGVADLGQGEAGTEVERPLARVGAAEVLVEGSGGVVVPQHPHDQRGQPLVPERRGHGPDQGAAVPAASGLGEQVDGVQLAPSRPILPLPAAGGEADHPARLLDHEGDVTARAAGEHPVPPLRVLVHPHGGQEAIRHQAGIGGPPALHVHPGDGVRVLDPGSPGGNDRHHHQPGRLDPEWIADVLAGGGGALRRRWSRWPLWPWSPAAPRRPSARPPAPPPRPSGRAPC